MDPTIRAIITKLEAQKATTAKENSFQKRNTKYRDGDALMQTKCADGDAPMQRVTFDQSTLGVGCPSKYATSDFYHRNASN